MRQAAKRDANHSQIVRHFRDIGASVLDLGAVGHGCPDILVGWCGCTFLIEIKDGSKPPSERKLTADQRDFFAAWPGQAFVAITPEDAITQCVAWLWERGL